MPPVFCMLLARQIKRRFGLFKAYESLQFQMNLSGYFS
jgi:hypothetical protein